ncbi:type II toxin-antitoxin system YafO family toxin [Pseudomonas sp. JZ134]|uniref:type II toxin-antitoxin system YafO family toxin n=1 Tax=Pseudomonas sp. JZ134 TaxID=2806615 RepID=UPI003DA06684
MYSVKVADEFKQNPHWYSIFVDFYNYKLCGDLPDYFGKDVPEDDFKGTFWHMHLTQDPKRVSEWSKTLDQNSRTNRLDPPNDFYLLYGKDTFQEEYLLLDIIGPAAHDRNKWRSYIGKLNTTVIEPWLQGKRKYDEEPDQ